MSQLKVIIKDGDNKLVHDVSKTNLNVVSLQREIEKLGDYGRRQAGGRALPFRLPHTNNNVAIQGDSDKVGVVNDVAAGLRDCVIEMDGLPLIIGQGKRTQSSEKEFEFEIWETAELIQAMAILKFKDFAPTNFVWSKANIQSVMSATAVLSPVDAGQEFVFAPVMYRFNQEGTWKSRELFPHMTITGILERGFNALGYKFESQYFKERDIGKRLVYLFTEGRFGNDENYYEETTNWLVGIDGTQTINGTPNAGFPTTHNVEFNDTSPPPLFNTGGAWNTGTDVATLVEGGEYTFNVVDLVCTVTSEESWTLGLWFYVDGTPTEQIFGVTSVNVVTFNGTITMDLNAGQTVELRLWVTNLGEDNLTVSVDSGTFGASKTPIYVVGDTINWERFMSKERTFLDFVLGLYDWANFYIDVNVSKKIARLEPFLGWIENDGETGTGYIDEAMTAEDLTGMIDLSKDKVLVDFDGLRREQVLYFLKDTNDGFLTRMEKENEERIGQAEYKFTDRFKAGRKGKQNRFFAPCVHVVKGTTQFVIMVRDVEAEIADSYAASDTDFEPRIAYYTEERTGDWIWDDVQQTTMNWLFMCNYLDDSGTDPNLFYSSQTVGLNSSNVVRGVLRKYWHRDFYMRKKRYINPLYAKIDATWFMSLNHRQLRSVDGMLYVLTNVRSYKPLVSELAKLTLWELAYPTTDDLVNITDGEVPAVIDFEPLPCDVSLLISPVSYNPNTGVIVFQAIAIGGTAEKIEVDVNDGTGYSEGHVATFNCAGVCNDAPDLDFTCSGTDVLTLTAVNAGTVGGNVDTDVIQKSLDNGASWINTDTHLAQWCFLNRLFHLISSSGTWLVLETTGVYTIGFAFSTPVTPTVVTELTDYFNSDDCIFHIKADFGGVFGTKNLYFHKSATTGFTANVNGFQFAYNPTFDPTGDTCRQTWESDLLAELAALAAGTGAGSYIDVGWGENMPLWFQRVISYTDGCLDKKVKLRFDSDGCRHLDCTGITAEKSFETGGTGGQAGCFVKFRLTSCGGKQDVFFLQILDANDPLNNYVVTP